MRVETFVLSKADLGNYINKLQTQYSLIGPIAKEEEAVFGLIESVDSLYLDYDTTILPPHKKYFLPPHEDLFKFQGPIDMTQDPVEPDKPQILFGVHACDVNGLASLDRVFLGTYPDPYYAQKRKNTLIIGLNCSRPCKNGFCSSFNTGPVMDEGFDLALTDMGDRFLVQVGSEIGLNLADGLRPASEADVTERNRILRASQQSMTRIMDTTDLTGLLHNNVEHPKWEELEDRCLACGSCTNVCPTCFCFAIEDKVDLSLTNGVREREWDSCQSYEFSRVAMDHVFRPNRAARIRHRINHKLTYFGQQFDGAPGCVGCGRCVTYCIVNIDPIDIISTIQASPAQPKEINIYRARPKKVCPDKSPWEPQPAVIKGIKQQTADTTTYTLSFADPIFQANYSYDPGVFNMISLAGLGEAPISISSNDSGPDTFDHTIRAVGNVTNCLAGLKVGDSIGIRGPYGTGWPVEEMKGKNVLLIAGGIGLAPLRPVIKHIQAHRQDYGKLEILYGARTPADRLFVDEYDEWRNIPDTHLHLTVDVVPSGTVWEHSVGVVTGLCNLMNSTCDNTIMVTCGPDIMMKFVVKDLLARQFSPEQIFISLERRMSCGIKKCGNCQIGPVFVCQDGPVFRYADVKDLPESVL